MSQPLAVGDVAPDVTAPLVRPDGSTADVSLSSLTDDRPTILAFYTNDFSPDCMAEWCSFRDYGWFANDERVQVVGVSRSHAATHRWFIDYLDLSFALYADRDLELAEAFGVDYRTFGLLRRAKRSVFFLGTDRTIRYRWIGDHPIDPARDQPPLAEVRAAVEDALGGAETETFGFE
ncbi:peroxiredoxin [Halarchaeum solikamskense]|uniref:redoxin domain-containing protein n=1 Tax=Halarchaeum nitratireducens TaxID=489913 RepID=UPI001B3B0F06|nr:redoxin domain-containing protein [Halarchaeum solikamskense]MBP2250423.1 peroxiredoxin [Halarchaeum solikamskense]